MVATFLEMISELWTCQVNVFCPPSVDPTQSVHASSSKGPSRVGSSEDEIPATPPAPAAPSGGTRGLPSLNYTSYMARLLAAEELTPLSSPGASSTEASPTIRGNVRHACRLNKHNIVIKEWCMFSQRILQLSCNKEQDRRSFLLTAMTLHDFFTLTCN